MHTIVDGSEFRTMRVVGGKINVYPSLWSPGSIQETLDSLFRVAEAAEEAQFVGRKGARWVFGPRKRVKHQALGQLFVGQIGRVGYVSLERFERGRFVASQLFDVATHVNFLCHLETELLVVEERRDLSFPQFAVGFAGLLREAGKELISGVTIASLIRSETFVEYVAKSKTLRQVRALVVRPNPTDEPEMARLVAELIGDVQASEARFYVSSDAGLNKNSRVLKELSELMQAGYAPHVVAEAVGEEGRVTRYDSASHREAEIIEAADSPDSIIEPFARFLKSLLQKRKEHR